MDTFTRGGIEREYKGALELLLILLTIYNFWHIQEEAGQRQCGSTERNQT